MDFGDSSGLENSPRSMEFQEQGLASSTDPIDLSNVAAVESTSKSQVAADVLVRANALLFLARQFTETGTPIRMSIFKLKRVRFSLLYHQNRAALEKTCWCLFVFPPSSPFCFPVSGSCLIVASEANHRSCRFQESQAYRLRGSHSEFQAFRQN